MQIRMTGLGSMMALLVLTACGGGDAPEPAEAQGSGEAEVVVGDGHGQVVTEGWDWSSRTEGAVEDVPFPVYPGARLVAFAEPMDEGDPQAVTLLTPDPLSNVVAFYGDELDGFRKREKYRTHTFWEGAESFDPLQDTDVANVQVRQSISSDSTYIYLFFPAGER